METIRGRKSLGLDLEALTKQHAGYNRITLDLGTGDGRYVHHLAENNPGWFVIGLDSCRENLHKHSRAKLKNMLFVIASAQELPSELNGLVSHITINFPWGSLLDSLLTGDKQLMHGLACLARIDISVDMRLNGGALAAMGWPLATGAEQICNNMMKFGWQFKTPVMMSPWALRTFPSSWAKRLAFGRDPRSMELSGRLTGPPTR